MSVSVPAKRRCASARLVTNTSQRFGTGAFSLFNDIKPPIRCSTASPLIPSSSSATTNNSSCHIRSPEPKDAAESRHSAPPNVCATSTTPVPKVAQTAEQRISELQKELLLVDSGEHPKLLERLRDLQQKQKDEIQMIDIMYEREKQEIERKFLREREVHEKDLKEREEELVQTMLSEIDDRIRFIEAEVAVLDVAGPACPTFSMNKKCLRRRPHDIASPTEKKRARAAAPPIIHLLPEHIIAEDVKLLAPPDSIPSVVQHHKVSLDNGKLIYEGKTYQRGQALVIQTENYGAFAGMLLSICEQYIQFRSTVPGDTRQVLATMDDLESGRVILRKKII